MPRYDIYCPKCTAESEVSHSIHQSPTFTCQCGTEMRKRISASPIVWGNGFTKPMDWGYKTDTIVNYPDGHSAHRTHNEMYEEGGL